MNAAESLVTTLFANGVEVCFTNPGTSEMHLVAALDGSRCRCVPALFEGVVTGAADGYYRMTGKPAATLLHLGPGLGNGAANLHNAKKARSAIANIVGDHATDHVRFESPLRSDIELIAAPLSHWVRLSRNSIDLAADGADALAATSDGALGRIATLIVPADVAWGAGGTVVPASAVERQSPRAPNADVVLKAARTLTKFGARAVLLLGAGGVSSPGLEAAAAIAQKSGCRVLTEFYNARMPGGKGHVYIERLPYGVDAAVSKLAGSDVLVLAGAVEPIAFFAYPGKPNQLKPPGCETLTLADARDDVAAALQALRTELGAKAAPAVSQDSPIDIEALRNASVFDPDVIGCALARLLPSYAIVVDEAVSSGRMFGGRFTAAEPHDWLAVMGGAIGFGLPAALGASIGAPGRPVLALEGDGSAMYTVQALWSLAREALPVVTVVFANRAYRILQAELKGVTGQIGGACSSPMLRLDQPALDWVALAKGHGVPAVRATTADSFVREVQRAFASGGPYLIEAVV